MRWLISSVTRTKPFNQSAEERRWLNTDFMLMQERESERGRNFSPEKSTARVSHHHNVQLAAKHTPAFHLSEVRDYKSDVICELNYCSAGVARSRSSIHKEQNRRGDRNEIRMTNVGRDIIQQTEDAEDTWGMQMTNEWVRSAATVVSQLKKIITVLLTWQPPCRDLTL